LVECDLAKVDVAGSNPVSRSRIPLSGSPMMKSLLILVCTVGAFAQEYKVEPIATGAPGLPAAYAALVDTKGYRVVGPKGPWCEIWFRKAIPTVSKPADSAITLPIAQGTFLGILRFPTGGQDRREQVLKAGVYTMRYSNFPVDGAHQGIAPQRDFALLTPVGNDADPNAMPEFLKLVEQSKTSGTSHPAVFSLSAPMGGSFPSIVKEGEQDYVLHVKVGELGIAIIVVGKAEG
jgi:hypothetical protein